MSDFNFSNNLESPTLIGKTSSTLIDIVFSNLANMVSETRTFGCPFSDHNFVIIALSTNKTRKGTVTFESRFITNEKLELTNQQLALVPFTMINSLPDINDKFHFFTKLILEVVDSVAPLKM